VKVLAERIGHPISRDALLAPRAGLSHQQHVVLRAIRHSIDVVILSIRCDVDSAARLSARKAVGVPVLIQRGHSIVVADSSAALSTWHGRLNLSLQQPKVLLAVEAAIRSAMNPVR
jgi:hypothetical protein